MRPRPLLVTLSLLVAAAVAAVVAVEHCGSAASPQTGSPLARFAAAVEQGGAPPAPKAQPTPVADDLDAGAEAGRVTQRAALLDGLIDQDRARLPVGVERWLRGFVSPAEGRVILRKNAQLAKESVDRYCEEVRELGVASFGPVTRSHDAAAFLAPRLDWEDGRRGSLGLPDSLCERLWSSTWPRQVTEDDLAGLDLGWMHELRQFDHWSLVSAEPSSELVARHLDAPAASSTTFFEAPSVPDYPTLMHWSKLRLASGLLHGDLRAAAADVHHLAELINSNDTMLSSTVAIRIVRFEREAWEAARDRGLERDGWQPPAKPSFPAHHLLLVAGANFLWPMVDDDVARKAFACMPAPCAALVQARAMARAASTVGSLSAPKGLDASSCDTAMLARADAVAGADPVDFVDEVRWTRLGEWARADAGAH